MEEEQIKLRATVRHKPTGIEGRVTTIHKGIASTQFNVEYVNKTGAICDHWALADELEPIDTASN